jgi:hypothetical protein
MILTAIRHTLSALAAVVLVSALASSPASTQGLWDHKMGPRGNLFSSNQGGQAGSTQSPTPSMSRPSSAKPALTNKNRQRSKSLSEPGVQKELSLTDEQ